MTNLRTNRRKVLKGAGAVAATAALLSPTEALAKTTSSSQSIVGSWLVDVTSSGSTNKALITFTKEGTLVETDQGDEAPPNLASPGHGVWVKTGSHEYVFTFMKLGYDTSGVLKVLIKIHATIQVNGDSYTGSGTVVGTDPSSGTVIFTIPFTVHATRIQVEGA